MVQRNNRTNLGLLLGRKNRLLSIARYISGAQKYKRNWPQAARTTIVIFDGAATETKRTRDARGAAVFRTFCIAEKLWQTNRRSRQTYRTANYASILAQCLYLLVALRGSQVSIRSEEGVVALTIQPSMRELVDGFAASARRQVPDTKRQMVEVEPSVFPFCKSEDEAERSPRRRNVDLDATRKTGSIPRLFVAGKERVDGLALALQARASFFADPLRTARRLAQIRMPDQLVKGDGSKAALERHDYPSPSGGWTGPYSASNSARVAGSWPRRSMMAWADVSGEITRRPSLRVSSTT